MSVDFFLQDHLSQDHFGNPHGLSLLLLSCRALPPQPTSPIGNCCPAPAQAVKKTEHQNSPEDLDGLAKSMETKFMETMLHSIDQHKKLMAELKSPDKPARYINSGPKDDVNG